MSSKLLEGAGWALLGAVTRTVVRHAAKTSKAGADTAGVIVPVLAAVLADRDPSLAGIGSSIGVGLSEGADLILEKNARLVFWSDDHGEPSPRREIIARMALEPSVDCYIFGGDAEGWGEWWRETAALRQKAPLIALPGNHDERPTPTEDTIALPAVLRFASANVVLLPNLPTAKQVQKVLSQLENVEHTLVFLHSSPIAFSRESQAGTTRVLDRLLPLLERGVRLFCGHHHVFGWGSVGPSSIVSAGIAGSKHYECLCGDGCTECDPDVRGYVRIDIGDQVKVAVVPVAVDHERS